MCARIAKQRGQKCSCKNDTFEVISFKFCELQKILNQIELKFSGVGFVCNRIKTFLLEVTLHQRIIFPFIWDNDLFLWGYTCNAASYTVSKNGFDMK